VSAKQPNVLFVQSAFSAWHTAISVYEPLRRQSALCSIYHKETKSDNLRNPLPAMAYKRC
jgi:hypothetical protein